VGFLLEEDLEKDVATSCQRKWSKKTRRWSLIFMLWALTPARSSVF